MIQVGVSARKAERFYKYVLLKKKKKKKARRKVATTDKKDCSGQTGRTGAALGPYLSRRQRNRKSCDIPEEDGSAFKRQTHPPALCLFGDLTAVTLF